MSTSDECEDCKAYKICQEYFTDEGETPSFRFPCRLFEEGKEYQDAALKEFELDRPLMWFEYLPDVTVATSQFTGLN